MWHPRNPKLQEWVRVKLSGPPHAQRGEAVGPGFEHTVDSLSENACVLSPTKCPQNHRTEEEKEMSSAGSPLFGERSVLLKTPTRHSVLPPVMATGLIQALKEPS
ncbi:hypothetical protein Mapa_006801 [Marchantia paleacea]|nr:hypothetical protein Mapa_006801 [Marchantia paleacea]